MSAAMLPISRAAVRCDPDRRATASAPIGPGLETYTDARTMQSLLQARLPGFADGGLRIESLEVCKVRRNASRHRNPCPMTLCYELQVSDIASGKTGPQMLYAKVFRDGLAASHFQAQNHGHLVTPAFGNALVHLRELNMLIWALPNDSDLPQLALLLDPARVEAMLPWAALRESMGLALAELGNAGVDMLRYEPQCRATLRYILTPADGSKPYVLYAKTFHGNHAEDIDRRFDYFWNLAATDASAPLVAQPLGYCTVTQTLWQAPAPGRPLLQSINRHNGAALMESVARALTLLHAAPLTPSADATPRSAAHWLTEARRRQKKISRANPALAARATDVADAIVVNTWYQSTRPLSLIHGDFHPDQIWVHGERIVLFDFDEFTLGDPMEDLASFALRLEQTCSVAGLSSRLIEHYAALAPERFDRRSLNWHLTVQSLLQASRAFVFQQPGWADELERRLARSEQFAAQLNMESAT